MTDEIIERSDELLRALSSDDLARFRELYLQESELRHSWPWLYTAARYGNLVAVQFLLQQGRDPNEVSNNSLAQSTLSAACSVANPDMVKLLIEAGASVEWKKPMVNPLFSAITNSSLECVKILVEAGIDIHKEYELDNGRSRNALELAELWGCKEIAEYLRARGAHLPDKNHATKAQCTCKQAKHPHSE